MKRAIIIAAVLVFLSGCIGDFETNTRSPYQSPGLDSYGDCFLNSCIEEGTEEIMCVDGDTLTATMFLHRPDGACGCAVWLFDCGE